VDLRHRHPKATVKELRRRYLPGLWPTPDEVRLFKPDTVAIVRCRYRGTAIPSPSATKVSVASHNGMGHVESRMRGTRTSGWEDGPGKRVEPRGRRRAMVRSYENAVVWSVDEKSGMQAKSRINPTLPAVPGIPARREFEYRRHGTAVLFAGLNVHEGDVAGWVTDSTRRENFVEFMGDLVRQTPPGLDLHCIVDNLKTHSTDLVETFLAAHPQVHLHFTPTHASWLNQVWVNRPREARPA